MDYLGIIGILLSLFVKFSIQHCIENLLHCTFGFCSENRRYLSYEQRRLCDDHSKTNYYELNCSGVINYLKTTRRHVIKSINIYASNISNVNEDIFADFDSLTALTMTGDNITTVAANAFSHLSYLERLNLSMNGIETLSKQFVTLPNLVMLDLSQNSINAIEEDAFENCNSLKELNVSHNCINEILINSLCLNLLVLNASHNNVAEFSINATQPLKLINLDLSWNNLSVSNEMFAHFKHLEILHLNNNPLFELPVGLFRSKTQLRYLNLSSTQLNKIRIGTFANLENLKVLDLSCNNLTALPKAFFHDLQQLEELYLNDNYFVSFQYNGLGKFRINLDNNLWNCGILADITHKLLESGVKIIDGSTYATENIFGIKCSTSPKETTDIVPEHLPTHIEKDNYTLFNSLLLKMQQLFVQQQKLSTQLAMAQSNQSNSNWNMLNKQLQSFHQQLDQTIGNALNNIGNILKSNNKTSTEGGIDLIKIENATINQQLQSFYQQLDQTIGNALNNIANIFKSDNKTSTEGGIDLMEIENARINQWMAFQTNFSQVLREDRVKFAKDIRNSLDLLGSKLQRNDSATLGYNTFLLVPVTSTEKEIVVSSTRNTKIHSEENTNLNQSYLALIVGVYSTFFILFVGLILLLVAKFRARKVGKYKTEECNPLNTI